MKRILVAFCLIACSVTQVKADFIYQNLVTEGTYHPTGGPSVATASSDVGVDSSPGRNFTAAITANETDVYIALWHVNGDNSFNVSLLDSTGTLTLDSWTGISVPNSGGDVPVVHLISTLNPLLTAGEHYILRASGNGTAWGAWESISNSLAGDVGFDVVSSSTSPVPEPSSMALLAVGGIGALVGAYRKRRQSKLAA